MTEAMSGVSGRVTAARNLIALLTPLAGAGHCGENETQAHSEPTANAREILASVQELLAALIPDTPLYAAFHDGQVHDPLGGGAYAFRDDLIEPLLRSLANDESDTSDKPSTQPAAKHPSQPIIIHAGAQPNNSPHCGTLIVFCYAFSVARAIRDRMQARAASTDTQPPPVSVEITFVDTAPVSGESIEIDGIQYQKSYREIPNALETHMGDYREVLAHLSTWSAIPFTIAFQSDFFSHPAIPTLLHYLITNYRTLGPQLSPKHGTLALRAACPVAGCGLAEKHGRLNQYHHQSPDTTATAITFHCPHHGPHTTALSQPSEVARLEANAPTRNLLRSMTHLLDGATHHVRVTGADYAGTYQEALLYRPLAAWLASTSASAAASAAAKTALPKTEEPGITITTGKGRTPHILYAPLVVDWSGAKLSKSLYVAGGRGYGVMGEVLETGGLCSYRVLKDRVGEEGLRRLWDEVERWVGDPRRLFRCWSVEYLWRVVGLGERVGEREG